MSVMKAEDNILIKSRASRKRLRGGTGAEGMHSVKDGSAWVTHVRGGDLEEQLALFQESEEYK